MSTPGIASLVSHLVAKFYEVNILALAFALLNYVAKHTWGTDSAYTA